MGKKTTVEMERLVKLRAVIEELFWEDERHLDMINDPEQGIVTQMFEVTEVHSATFFELTDLFSDEVYDPVFIFERIAKHLRVGDTFMMTLSFMGDDWGVLSMSPPYESENIETTLYLV